MATVTVLEIGADTVRVAAGPGGPVNPRLAEAAVQWIDDPIGLYDERPVAVADLWRAVMAAAAGGEPLVIVHPDDWTDHRIDRVVAAANAVVDEVMAVPRRQWGASADSRTAPEPIKRPRRTLVPVAMTAVTITVLAAGIAAWPKAWRTVSEGRVVVGFPADWTVTRVTGGPGSRRLQATAPDDPELAVHVTQSYLPDSTLAAAAEVLRRVIDDEPAGVFVDFHADGRAGGRPAVTYREVRTGKVIDWSVLLAGSTLIGIGCQSPPQRPGSVRAACDQAAESASEIGTDPRR